MKAPLKLLLISCIAAVSADCPQETEVSLDYAIEKVTVSDYNVESVNRYASETPVSDFLRILLWCSKYWFFSHMLPYALFSG